MSIEYLQTQEQIAWIPTQFVVLNLNWHYQPLNCKITRYVHNMLYVARKDILEF